MKKFTKLLLSSSIIAAFLLFAYASGDSEDTNSKNAKDYDLNSFKNEDFKQLINDLGGSIKLEKSYFMLNADESISSYNQLIFYPDGTVKYSWGMSSDFKGGSTANGTWSTTHDISKALDHIDTEYENVLIEISLNSGEYTVGQLYEYNGEFVFDDSYKWQKKNWDGVVDAKYAIDEGTLYMPDGKITF